MSDEVLSLLKRQLALYPHDLERRGEYYRVLVRMGRNEAKAIQFAASHGDPVAQLALGPNRTGERIKSDADLALLQDLAMPLPYLDLRDCIRISGTGLAYLKGLEVKSLDLSGLDRFYNDETIVNVLRSFALDSLGLWGCEYFGRQEIELFKDLPIERLDLSKRRIRATDIISMVHSGLDPTDLATQLFNRGPSDNEPDPLIHYLESSKLRKLDLSNTEEDLRLFLEALPAKSLESLTLKRCNSLSEEDLRFLVPLSLKHLDLAFCHNVMDEGVAFLRELPLQSLSLEGCSNLTNIAFKNLASLPLQELNLWRCTGVDDETLLVLGHLPLRKLNLWGCDKITDVGLSYLKDCPLEDLNLGGCRKVTSKALRALDIERLLK
ncbi:MAG: hypothetical protein P1V97_14835 [Planctomycetota bacterium]|nr:hypothetical protein [Planctomycetota bacterium]